jgi:hypothetical protein
VEVGVYVLVGVKVGVKVKVEVTVGVFVLFSTFICAMGAGLSFVKANEKVGEPNQTNRLTTTMIATRAQGSTAGRDLTRASEAMGWAIRGL